MTNDTKPNEAAMQSSSPEYHARVRGNLKKSNPEILNMAFDRRLNRSDGAFATVCYKNTANIQQISRMPIRSVHFISEAGADAQACQQMQLLMAHAMACASSGDVIRVTGRLRQWPAMVSVTGRLRCPRVPA